MATELKKTGMDAIGDMPWGTHVCQFYETTDDLLDILVPYFNTGLANNESCICVCSESFDEETAKNALQYAIPEADRYLAA